MKYTEINNRYTAIVAEYLSKGYTFNTATMPGSQGERAKVDLTDGKEVIRIVLDSFSTYDDICLQGWKIVIGRAGVEDAIIPNCPDDGRTLWNSHLDILSEEFFYRIGRRGNYFGTKEEAEAAAEKSVMRWNNKSIRSNTEYTTLTNPAAAEIAAKYLMSNGIFKCVDKSCVVVRKRVYKRNHVTYIVEYHGKVYSLD